MSSVAILPELLTAMRTNDSLSCSRSNPLRCSLDDILQSSATSLMFSVNLIVLVVQSMFATIIIIMNTLHTDNSQIRQRILIVNFILNVLKLDYTQYDVLRVITNSYTNDFSYTMENGNQVSLCGCMLYVRVIVV